MMDIQTGVALCKVKEFEDGQPKYVPSGCRPMRTTSGLQILNEIGRRWADGIEHEACAMMSKANRGLLNLVQDQLLHGLQILSVWIAWVVKGSCV